MSRIYPILEQRTSELLACIERRQLESKDGMVDLVKGIEHWAYDLMVCFEWILDWYLILFDTIFC